MYEQIIRSTPTQNFGGPAAPPPLCHITPLFGCYPARELSQAYDSSTPSFYTHRREQDYYCWNCVYFVFIIMILHTKLSQLSLA